VLVTDQGDAVPSAECGAEMVPHPAKKPAARKALKPAAAKKTTAKQPAARKAAPKKKQ
jgi:hypothetical protein